MQEIKTRRDIGLHYDIHTTECTHKAGRVYGSEWTLYIERGVRLAWPTIS